MNTPTPKIIVFTGAGISADSGLSTFRGNGLWDKHKVEDVCTLYTWKRNFGLVHRFYNERRLQLGESAPNRAHRVVARWAERLPTLVITQNVDDLHERGGCKEVLHVHGLLTSMHCTACGKRFGIGYREWSSNDRCPCGSLKGVKPDVVFFGESAPNYVPMRSAFKSLGARDLLVTIGTSGQVIDIGTVSAGAKCMSVLSNLHSSDVGALDNQFSATAHGRATEKSHDLDLVVQVWAESVGLPYDAAEQNDDLTPTSFSDQQATPPLQLPAV